MQKIKSLRDSLAVLSSITGIALDVAINALETEQLNMDEVPPVESPVRPDSDVRKRPLTSPDQTSPAIERASKRINVSHTPDKEQPPRSRRNLFGTNQVAQSASPRIQVITLTIRN